MTRRALNAKYIGTRIVRVLVAPILWALYVVSGCVQRDPRIAVYGATGDRFADNAKYAFIRANRADGSVDEHYWVTGSRQLVRDLEDSGYKAVHRWSLKGVFVCMRASRYYFITYCSDINFWTSRGAQLVNYWHGLPLKRIEYDIDSGPFRNCYNPKTLAGWVECLTRYIINPAYRTQPTVLYSPHPAFDDLFARAFRIPYSSLVRKRYPRVAALVERRQNLNSAVAKGTRERCVGAYLPTMRDGRGSEWLRNCLLDYAEPLDAALTQNHITLLIKAHPNEAIAPRRLGERLIIVDSKEDTYALLENVDFIITDYSSIIFDAAEIDLPVYLFWPDHDEFRSETRGFYFDLEEFFCGRYIHSAPKLLQLIGSGELRKMDVTNIVKGRLAEKDLARYEAGRELLTGESKC